MSTKIPTAAPILDLFFGILILSCFACIAFVFFLDVLVPLSPADKAGIEARFKEFCAARANRQFEITYEFMSSSYRKEFSSVEHVKNYKSGSPEEQGLSGACQLRQEPKRSFAGAALYEFEPFKYTWYAVGATAYFVKEGDIWYIDDSNFTMD